MQPPETDPSNRNYRRPGWFTARVFNPAVARLAVLGVTANGTRLLEVRGRRTGLTRRTPVNVLQFDGTPYLLAPRGHTEWVRNLRATPNARLILGRQDAVFTATEVPDAEKPAVIRAYLQRWGWQVGTMLPGLTSDSTDQALLRAAPQIPVFRLDTHSERHQ